MFTPSDVVALLINNVIERKEAREMLGLDVPVKQEEVPATVETAPVKEQEAV